MKAGLEEMKILVGDTEVPVTWEENASVDELRTLLPLTIDAAVVMTDRKNSSKSLAYP